MASAPILNVDLLQVSEIMELGVGASGIESGQALAGGFGATDFTGGGQWRVGYTFDLFSRPQHKYYNKMKGRLTGSVLLVTVPLLTDWIGPFEMGDAGVLMAEEGILFDDGTTFSDGAGFSQDAVQSHIDGDHALHAGTVSFVVDQGGEAIVGGEIFSLYHLGGARWRSYQIIEVDTDDGAGAYTVGIRPNLREETPDLTQMRWARPLVTCRLAPGSDNMPYSVSEVSRAILQATFVEAPVERTA